MSPPNVLESHKKSSLNRRPTQSCQFLSKFSASGTENLLLLSIIYLEPHQSRLSNNSKYDLFIFYAEQETRRCIALYFTFS
jgi:hypothetical protein